MDKEATLVLKLMFGLLGLIMAPTLIYSMISLAGTEKDMLLDPATTPAKVVTPKETASVASHSSHTTAVLIFVGCVILLIVLAFLLWKLRKSQWNQARKLAKAERRQEKLDRQNELWDDINILVGIRKTLMVPETSDKPISPEVRALQASKLAEIDAELALQRAHPGKIAEETREARQKAEQQLLEADIKHLVSDSDIDNALTGARFRRQMYAVKGV